MLATIAFTPIPVDKRECHFTLNDQQMETNRETNSRANWSAFHLTPWSAFTPYAGPDWLAFTSLQPNLLRRSRLFDIYKSRRSKLPAFTLHFTSNSLTPVQTGRHQLQGQLGEGRGGGPFWSPLANN